MGVENPGHFGKAVLERRNDKLQTDLVVYFEDEQRSSEEGSEREAHARSLADMFRLGDVEGGRAGARNYLEDRIADRSHFDVVFSNTDDVSVEDREELSRLRRLEAELIQAEVGPMDRATMTERLEDFLDDLERRERATNEEMKTLRPNDSPMKRIVTARPVMPNPNYTRLLAILEECLSGNVQERSLEEEDFYGIHREEPASPSREARTEHRKNWETKHLAGKSFDQVDHELRSLWLFVWQEVYRTQGSADEDASYKELRDQPLPVTTPSATMERPPVLASPSLVGNRSVADVSARTNTSWSLREAPYERVNAVDFFEYISAHFGDSEKGSEPSSMPEIAPICRELYGNDSDEAWKQTGALYSSYQQALVQLRTQMGNQKSEDTLRKAALNMTSEGMPNGTTLDTLIERYTPNSRKPNELSASFVVGRSYFVSMLLQSYEGRLRTTEVMQTRNRNLG